VAAIVAAFAVVPSVAFAQEVPNLVGTWEGTLHGMSVGAGPAPGPRPEGGTWDKPVIEEAKVITRVTGQQGRYFWGEREFANGQKYKMMGMFTDGNKDFLGVVSTGHQGPHFSGTFADGKMQWCVGATPLTGSGRYDVACSTSTRVQ